MLEVNQMRFKDLFEKINNPVQLEAEMNNAAYPYLEELRHHGVDNLEECKYFLLCLDKLYQLGRISPLRDPEYDEALDIYLDAGGEMIRGDMSSGDKAVHVYPSLKGTIKKVHYISEEERKKRSNVPTHKSLEQWLQSVRTELLDNGYKPGEIELGLYTKYDGLSLILEVENGKIKSAITRGDKDLGMGQNKSKLFRRINFEGSDFAKKFGLKCEALVSYDNFKKYNKKFGNGELVDPRSAATAILNSDNPALEELTYLTLMPLMIIVDGVEYPIPNKHIDPFPWAEEFQYGARVRVDLNHLKGSIVAVEETIKFLTDEIKEHLAYPADGIVIRIEDPEIKSILGRNEAECINNWERAYKFPPETKKSKVVDIVQEIGSMGKLSFVAVVKPVTIKNKVIQRVSLGSLARFMELNLAPDDEVLVQYDIIPYLTVDSTCKRSGNKPFEYLKVCPDCGEPLMFFPELGCMNPNCPSRIIGKISNYCSKMNIYGVADGIITTLYHKGILNRISDLYKLEDNYEKMLEIEGFGKKKANNIIEAVNKVDSVDPYTLLGSMGIQSAGRRMFQRILKKIPFGDLIEFDVDDVPKLCNIEGIKFKTARKIVEGLMENRKELERILKYVKLNSNDKKYKMTVCFTKVRNHKFEEFLDKMGIKSTDTFTKDVDMLIAAPGVTKSSKIDKAAKWGIPIMSINEAYVHFGYSEY